MKTERDHHVSYLLTHLLLLFTVLLLFQSTVSSTHLLTQQIAFVDLCFVM